MDEYTNKECMQQELEIFGFYLSNHPVLEARLKYNKPIKILELNHYFDKQLHF